MIPWCAAHCAVHCATYYATRTHAHHIALHICIMMLMIGIYLDTRIIYSRERENEKKTKNEKTKLRGKTQYLDMIEVGV